MTPDVKHPGELFDLSGLRAAVVGGTGVLGSRFAECVAAAGAAVTVLGRSEERGRSIVDRIRTTGGSASFARVDTTDRASIESAAHAMAGDGALDVLINAVGVNSTTEFGALSDSEWGRLLEVNLTSVFRTCQTFSPLMRRQEGTASIINISSASSGPPLSRVLGYGVAKAGLNNLTQYLARELAPEGIRVNAIIPGFFPAEQNRAVLTPERIANIEGHTPMRRLGNPHELDGVVLWLAAPLASGFVTGSLVAVDGGFSAMTI